MFTDCGHSAAVELITGELNRQGIFTDTALRAGLLGLIRLFTEAQMRYDEKRMVDRSLIGHVFQGNISPDLTLVMAEERVMTRCYEPWMQQQCSNASELAQAA